MREGACGLMPLMMALRRLPGMAVGLGSRSLGTKPTYSQRMDKTGRPISPHVFIYRFPAIALSSITVRITGMMATFGFFGVGAATIYGGGDWVYESLLDFGGITKRAVGMDLSAAAKASVAFVLSYQWFGSARHMYWDLTAKGFNNSTMLHSSYAMVGVTTLITLGAAAYTLPPKPGAAQK